MLLEQLDSQDENMQTTDVLRACKMPLMHMIDSADVSGFTYCTFCLSEGYQTEFEITVA